MLDWQEHTKLIDYVQDDLTIVYFWHLLKNCSEQDKSLLLQFVTSCPRPSFLGFKDIHPQFTIRKSERTDMLPQSQTCVNTLVLPDYG